MYLISKTNLKARLEIRILNFNFIKELLYRFNKDRNFHPFDIPVL